MTKLNKSQVTYIYSVKTESNTKKAKLQKVLHKQYIHVYWVTTVNCDIKTLLVHNIVFEVFRQLALTRRMSLCEQRCDDF